jgi:putative transposase
MATSGQIGFAFPEARRKPHGVRIVHMSIQGNHVHLIVEAIDEKALAAGVQRFEIILAKAINRVLERKGKVVAFRYHRVDITTPRQMRNALSYVLNNWRRIART